MPATAFDRHSTASELAVVAWERELTCPTVNAAAIQQFVADHRNRAPEDVCSHGSVVP